MAGGDIYGMWISKHNRGIMKMLADMAMKVLHKNLFEITLN
jgi:hypothetical protein